MMATGRAEMLGLSAGTRADSWESVERVPYDAELKKQWLGIE